MASPISFNLNAKTLQIAVTASASTSKALPAQGSTLLVVNEGTATAYIAVGSGVQTATVPSTTTPVTGCTPVLAGAMESFTIPSDQIYNISAITATGTATLDVQVGEGQ